MEEVAAQTSHEAPAPKKLKQACLPFMNMLSKQAPICVKKRKRSSDGSLVVQKSPRVQRVEKCDDDSVSRKVMASKVCNADNEVSSSSWNGKCDKTPKSKASAGPLDNYMRTTQQREVSTSVVDDEGVIDLTDAYADSSINSGKNACNNNDVCEDVAMDVVNSLEEDKENVASVTISDVSTCEKDCKTNADCEIREADSDNEAESDNEADSDNEAESENEAEAENEADADNEAESDNEAEEVSASSGGKKGDEKLTTGDVHCDGTSSTEVASPRKRSDSPSVDLNESLVGNNNEVTPKKSDSAKNCATPTSSGVAQSSPCPSSPGTGFTTPVSCSKFKTPKSSTRKRSAETLKKQQEKGQEKLEKQRQRQEQKAEKEQQKVDKDRQRSEEKERKLKVRLEKEREVKEQKEKKGKERDEKLKQKEEERKQKEEERKKKDDERKKKHDIIDEEKKKKEDDKKKKEEEKQKIDEDKNRKKQKESIQNFFTKKTTSPPKVEAKKGLFMAFEVKKEMKLAPLNRATLDGESHLTLDTLLETQNHTHTFLEECKTRPRLSTPQTWPSNDKEVEIIEADCGTARLEPMKVKLLQFCENYRPAYYGTWGKKSAYICPRNPLKKDKDLLDYEVDSDEEWEEEEPGESLSHSEGEDGGDDADNDSEDEDGFFVPHGYLSEGEGCEDAEEDMSIEKRKAVQLARTKKWEMDRTKKCEALKRQCIGVSWWSPDATAGEDPMQMVLAKFHAVLLTPTPITVVRPVSEKKDQDKVAAKKGAVIRSVPEAALPHLARLVHGNVCSIQKVVKEFREYWCRHTDGDASLMDCDASTIEKPTDESVIKKDSNDSVANCSVGDVSMSDADGDVSMIANDGDTSVIDKDDDVSVAEKDGVVSMTEKDGDTSIVDKDGDMSMTHKDMSVTGKDGDTSMVREDGDTSLTKNKDGDVTTDAHPEDRYTFSKRQLDKTIRKLAVYERRPQYRRCCWYVHQSVLEKYALTELPIPTQWHWLTRPNVSPNKKKVVAPRVRGSSTPVCSNTPTIKQFAVPNLKPTVNPIRKRPQFTAMNAGSVGSEGPIVIEDVVCLDGAATVSPSSEIVSNVSNVLVPRAAVVCEDSNSLVLHFSESESGIADDRSNDAVTSKASFPKFTNQSNRQKCSGNNPGNKGKGKDKARRVMPTLLSMFGSQTKMVATTNNTTKQSTTSNLPGSDSAPIEID